jgi:hypothetical protein
VTYKWAALLDIGKSHKIDLIWKDSAAAVFTNTANIVGTFMPGSPANMFLVEAEDFNHDGGQTVVAASTMPYLGGAYSNLSATVGIDYFRTDNVTNNWGIYRNINLAPPLPMNEQLDANGTVRASDASGNPTWVQTANYRLGWAGGGNWMDYTRQIPAGTYQVWASQSYDLYADGNIVGNLSKVTSDPTQSGQTIENVGYFRGPATGGWGANQLFPLRTNTNPTGDAAIVSLGGSTSTTLRFEYASGDFDYFMLVPASTTQGPKIDKISVVAGKIQIVWQGTATLQSATLLPAAAANWADVTGATSPTAITPPASGNIYYRLKQ